MELYLKNKGKYKEDASKSIYDKIRKAVVADETESSEFLNVMLRDEVNGKNDDDVVRAIFSNKIFEIEEETIKVLATSEYFMHRARVAELSKDSKFLNEMLRNEIYNWECDVVIRRIFNNEVFEIEEETIKSLASACDWEYRQKAAKLSKDSKFLNEMLRNEIDGSNSEYVIKEIFTKEIFAIEEKTIKTLASACDWEYRQKAAKLSKDSKFLNQMLIKEVKGKEDEYVIDAILENEAFIIEEETIKDLASAKNWLYRQKAAELLKDSKFLNEMLIEEVKGKEDDDVINAILGNEAFKIEEETMKILKESKNEDHRQLAARISKDSKELIEMFVDEMKSYDTSIYVIETILTNEAFVLDEEQLLEYIEDNY